MHVRLQEGDEVGARLADDEVVHIEKFGDALERRVPVRVRGVCPVAEVGSVGSGPWHDGAMDVFGEDFDFAGAVERGRRGIRCYGGCPYQLVTHCQLNAQI